MKCLIFNVNLEKEKLPFKDDYFDVIFTKSVIEHNNNLGNFMEECNRVLKPGGRIICMTPDWKTTFKYSIMIVHMCVLIIKKV